MFAPGASRAGFFEKWESIGAEILRVVSAYEAVERTTASRDTAVHRLRTQLDRFDPGVVKALTELLDRCPAGTRVGNFNPDLLPNLRRCAVGSATGPLYVDPRRRLFNDVHHSIRGKKSCHLDPVA